MSENRETDYLVSEFTPGHQRAKVKNCSMQAWPEGCYNARDLGGLVTRDGRRIRPGALLRSDAVDHLTARGWRQLADHGVKTIIDLRNEDEIGSGSRLGLRTVHLPHDSWESQDFWKEWAGGPQFGTPLYYGPHLNRFPERTARVLQAIAEAERGVYWSIARLAATAPEWSSRSCCICSAYHCPPSSTTIY